MNKVIQFLISRINFFTFLFFQIICFVLIFSNNQYQSAAFYNSSNGVTGKILEASNNAKYYFELKNVNEQLATENANLRKLLAEKSLKNDPSFFSGSDTTYVKKYRFIPAKVINNSTNNFKNYITINKGLIDSIAPGMGVISKNGIVGKVKACSKYYATITSVLNKDNLVSCKLKNSKAIGSIKWEGIDASEAKLLYVPRHLRPKVGDTIVTSEFNAVYPEGEMVGKIKKITIKGDDNFYNIDVSLSTDFNSISYVYVIKDKLKFQLDSLEKSSIITKDETK